MQLAISRASVVRTYSRRIKVSIVHPTRPWASQTLSRSPRRIWNIEAAAGGGGGTSDGGNAGGGSGGHGDQWDASGSDPHPLRALTFGYAVLLAAGGVFAFLKKGSTKSLSAAGGSALILALCGRAMVGPGAKGALAVATAVSLLLSVVMARRFSSTGKVVPAGATAAVSLAMCAAYLFSLF